MSAADTFLTRLLKRCDSASSRGESKSVSLSMTSRGAPEYLSLSNLADFEQFHARIAIAEREGAIAAVRERGAGDDTRLVKVVVVDAEKLAHFLGLSLLQNRCAEARRVLEPWTSAFPVIAEVLEAWMLGRKLLGGPEGAADLAAAARVVKARADDSAHERILRRESARLFGNSKRIERLTPHLDVLLTNDLLPSNRMPEETWAEIGLRREPQPLLLSGTGDVTLETCVLPLIRPYIGLPMESVQSLSTAADFVMTIENLASFHDAASCTPSGLLIYTGGMPSPAWRRAFLRILLGLKSNQPVFHWGDIDEGGFRIAATLAQCAQGAGHTLRPWLMSVADLPGEIARNAVKPTASVQSAMIRWAYAAGWKETADALHEDAVLVEQESLSPRFPGRERQCLGLNWRLCGNHRCSGHGICTHSAASSDAG